jgi:hypothetical protein
MQPKTRRVLTGLAATGVLAGGLAAGGIALATTTGAAQPVTVAATVPAAAAPAASTTVSTATGTKGGVRFLRRHHGARLVIRTAAAYLGLTPAQLRSQLHAGKSLSEVAAAQNKPVSGLENAILAAVVKRVDASKLTTARKADVISAVRRNLGAFVAAAHPLEKADRTLGKALETAAGSAVGAA